MSRSVGSGEHIAATVRAAVEDGRQLRICGSGSKRDWRGADSHGDMLSLTEHAGIKDYDGEELVITARAGTPLKELRQTLAQGEQMLSSDPPLYFGEGTVGGMVSAGLSGPTRPWGGSVRDAVLGAEIVNGLGERLKFGGQVMKNVAGYDVSRLMTGAFGSLGVLLSVSLRVQPAKPTQTTLRLELSANEAIATMRGLARRNLPLWGTWWHGGVLYVRLAGSEAAVVDAIAKIGGERTEPGPLWEEVRDQRLPFFKADDVAASRDGQSLWRIVVPPAAPMPDVAEADAAVEWGGGLRWVWHPDATYVRDYAEAHQGWAWARGGVQPVPAGQRDLMRALREAFDPKGVFVSGLGV